MNWLSKNEQGQPSSSQEETSQESSLKETSLQNSSLHGTALDIVQIAVMLALIEVGKRALDFLPNVEVVTLFFMLFTKHFGKKVYLVALLFVLVETIYIGPHVWVIMYLYIWPLLITIVLLIRKKAEWWVYPILSAFYGLFFGFLCSIPYYFISGIGGGIAWWIAGIPYDLIHCGANLVVALVLFRPLDIVLGKILGEKEVSSAEE